MQNIHTIITYPIFGSRSEVSSISFYDEDEAKEHFVKKVNSWAEYSGTGIENFSKAEEWLEDNSENIEMTLVLCTSFLE